jgi:mRNA-degrading endonuclease toxin of MazEF toxin-antitoxin module
MIRAGEIYLADFDEIEPHPVVVVSREELNRGNWVAAVLITSNLSSRFGERSLAVTLGRLTMSGRAVL